MVQISTLVTQRICRCKDFLGRKVSALKSVVPFEGSLSGRVSHGGGMQGMSGAQRNAAGWLCGAALGGTFPSAPLGTSGKREHPHLLLGVWTAVVYSSWCISVKTAGFSCKIQQPGRVPGVREHAARASAWKLFANRQIPSGFYCLPLDHV